MDNFMKEPFDLRRFMLLMIRKIGLLFSSIIFGAVIFGVIYYAKHMWLSGPLLYQSSTFYEIVFDREQVEDIHDYYNDYTWNEVLDSDAIAGRASAICGIEKEKMAEMTDIPTMSDIRFIWLNVESPDPEEAENVQAAIGRALEEFALEKDGFTSITPFDQPATKKLERAEHVKRWCVLGGVCGLVAALLSLLYTNAMDDSMYIEADVQKRFGKLCAGVLGKGNPEDTEEYFALQANLQELTKDKKSVVFAEGYENAFPENMTEEILRKLIQREGEPKKTVDVARYHLGKEREYFVKVKNADCVIWMIPFGKMNGSRLDRAWKNLQFWNCHVDTVVLIDVDTKYYRAYYRLSK